MVLKHPSMRQPRKMVVYSDVDGTLVSGSNELHGAVVKQIERFVEMGYGFSLATGRSLAGIKRFLQQLPLTAPLVLCNGAYIYDPLTHEAEWTAINKEIVGQLLVELIPLSFIRISIERADHSLWVSDAGAFLDPFILQEGLQPVVWPSMQEIVKGADILKVGIKILDSSLAAYEQLTDRLTEQQLAFHDQIRWCFSSNDYVEILAEGVSKWKGILQSQQIQGFPEQLICTIGDHQNDLEMVQHADIGIAMGNAIEEVKKVADYSIGHVDQQAIAEWLEKLMMERQSNNKEIINGN